jgi:hypothetical protein
MPIPFTITAISGTYPDMAVSYYEKAYFNLIGIFYPPGEPISPQWFRRSPFAVVHSRPDLPSFMGHFLAVAAILGGVGWP